MRFSWKALALAPLPVPVVVALLITYRITGGDPVFSFLFFLLPGCAIAYGATALLLLPAMSVLSRLVALTTLRASLLGAVLGGIAYLPLILIAWRASGPDSGPPETTFIETLLQYIAEPVALVFPLGGLITAAVYFCLADSGSRADGADG